MITLEKLSLEPLRHICANMRERDAKEIFGLRWDDDPDSLAGALAAQPLDLADVYVLDGEPVAVSGAMPAWPGVWNVFAFGTDKWDNVAVSITKRTRRFIMPALLGANMHQAHCWSAAAHTKAHAWMERSLGAHRGPTIEGFGRDGSAYTFFSWDRAAVEKMSGASHVFWRKT